MISRKVIVIENLEDKISRWVIEEYIESYRVALANGLDLVVSGIIPGELESILGRSGVRIEREASRLYNRVDAILLDLWADKILEPDEAQAANIFIVGGIMGDYPPRGRTRLLYDKYSYATRRSLGSYQFSVDGAIKVLAKVIRGYRVEDIEIVYPLVVKIRGLTETEIILPYAYPVEDGKPQVSESIVRLLEKGLAWDELISLSP
ncbi:MAG: hypothetical protein QXR02_04200 [Acidilobaceae archaeon]